MGAGNTEVYLLEDRAPLGVYTVNGAGAVISSYFNLHAGDRVVGRQPSTGSRSYYHLDLLGSTRAVVQGASVTESYDYDPWGVLMSGRTLSSGTKEQFTTKERDSESQLDYFGARSYASAIGRWTTVDPAIAADSTPQWGPFNYVKDNPANYSDPYGLCPICIPFIVAGLEATGADLAFAGAASVATVLITTQADKIRDAGRAIGQFLQESADKVGDAIRDPEGSGKVEEKGKLRHVDRTGEGSSASEALKKFGDTVEQPAEPSSHPEITQVRIPGGGTASARPSSRTVPPTVQVTRPKLPTIKVRFDKP